MSIVPLPLLVTEVFGSTGLRNTGFSGIMDIFAIPKLKFSIKKSRKLWISGNSEQNGHSQLIRYFRKPLYYFRGLRLIETLGLMALVTY